MSVCLFDEQKARDGGWKNVWEEPPRDGEFVFGFFALFKSIRVYEYVDLRGSEEEIFGVHQFVNRSGYLTDDIEWWKPLQEARCASGLRWWATRSPAGIWSPWMATAYCGACMSASDIREVVLPYPFIKRQYALDLCELFANRSSVMPQSPALKLKALGYPAHWEGKVPRMVRMLRPVSPCIVRQGAPKGVEIGEEFEAMVNSYGAVSALLPGGFRLGLRPGEFEVIEFHQAEGNL